MIHIFSPKAVVESNGSTVSEKVLSLLEKEVGCSSTAAHVYQMSGVITVPMEDDTETNKSRLMGILEKCMFEVPLCSGNDVFVDVFFVYFSRTGGKGVYVVSGYAWRRRGGNESIPFTEFVTKDRQNDSSEHADTTPLQPISVFMMPSPINPAVAHAMTNQRVVTLMKCLFPYIQSKHLVPAGASLYDCSPAATIEEQDLMLRIAIATVDENKITELAARFSRFFERCCREDATFFRRQLSHNPFYAECNSPQNVCDKLRATMERMRDVYSKLKLPYQALGAPYVLVADLFGDGAAEDTN